MFLLIYSIRKKDVVPKETKNNVTDFEMNIYYLLLQVPSQKSHIKRYRTPNP